MPVGEEDGFMPTPPSRQELIEQVESALATLRGEMNKLGADAGPHRCVATWSVKNLRAFRAWWTERVRATVDERVDRERLEVGVFY